MPIGKPLRQSITPPLLSFVRRSFRATTVDDKTILLTLSPLSNEDKGATGTAVHTFKSPDYSCKHATL